jgi:hypothetical protein
MLRSVASMLSFYRHFRLARRLSIGRLVLAISICLLLLKKLLSEACWIRWRIKDFGESFCGAAVASTI